MTRQNQSAEPTVFVVDDDPSVRESLGGLFRSVKLRVELFSSAQDFLKHQRPDVPACLVLDVRLPGLSGLELQQELGVHGSAIPIIFITGHGDIPMSVRAMKQGAVEFLTKPFRNQDLLDAVHHAIERDRVGLKLRVEQAELRARYDSLSAREREVMARVVRGMLNKQIASELGTTEITVKTQRASAMKKMQAVSVTDLVRFAQTLGLEAKR